MSISLLRVERLSVRFMRRGKPPVHAVSAVSFEVRRGSMVALVGESGSGKSVTALALLGLLPQAQARIDPDSRIFWGSENLLMASQRRWRALRGQGIAMIFQDPQSALNPVLTIGFQLAEALRRGGVSSHDVRKRALELLVQVGIDRPEARWRSYPHELSGGQQQRVMIAMAISAKPQLLIADEPTTALDVTVQRQIMVLLKRLQQELGLALLFITHDLALVGEFADEVVVMRQGAVVEQGAAHDLLHRPQAHYTRALLACRPTLALNVARLPIIGVTGEVQWPLERPVAPRPMTGEVVLAVEGIGKTYVTRDRAWKKVRQQALQPISFTLQAGRTLGVVGESGSGKSTLARMVAGILPPDEGRLRFTARSDVTPGYAVQMVFQNPFASLNPRFTVAQLLQEPLKIHRLGASDDERRHQVLRWLERVGLPEDAMERYPHEFSGGQRQRLAIARCLTLSPRVLICDESVAALDVSIQAQILNLLKDLQDELGMSYLFISHDLSVVRFMADELLVLQAGQVMERGPVDDVLQRPTSGYTRQLLEAVPRIRD